jgi:GxxExxY protein
VKVPIVYKGIQVGEIFVDVLVDGRLVLELKACESLIDVHKGQAVGYLQALNLQLALLVNFNVELIRNGIKRVVNTYKKQF